MTRLWTGILLLAGLFLGCLGVGWEMQDYHKPIERNLAQAAAFSETDPTQAQYLVLQARQQWNHRWQLTAAFADHTPMEEIDALFSALTAYEPDSTEFRDYCLQLQQRTRAMAQAQAWHWWNLL